MTSNDPRTGARVSSEAVTPAFPPFRSPSWRPPSRDATMPWATPQVAVTDVAFDSREVTPGAVFFCVPGASTSTGTPSRRRRWTPGAARSSWSAGSTSTRRRSLVPSVREAMGPMSAAAFGHPASRDDDRRRDRHERQDHRHVPARVDLRGRRVDAPASIGTTGARVAGDTGAARAHDAGGARPAPAARADARRRRPRPWRWRCRRTRSTQHRVDGVVVRRRRSSRTCRRTTSTTTRTMEAYFEAKARLFTPAHARRARRERGRSVRDAGCSTRLEIPTTTFGVVDHEADLRARDVVVDARRASRSRVDGPRGPVAAARGVQRGELSLAAIGAARALGIDDDAIVDGVGGAPRGPRPDGAGRRRVRTSWWWWITHTRRIASEACCARRAR